MALYGIIWGESTISESVEKLLVLLSMEEQLLSKKGLNVWTEQWMEIIT